MSAKYIRCSGCWHADTAYCQGCRVKQRLSRIVLELVTVCVCKYLSYVTLKPRSLAPLLRPQYELASGIWINILQVSMFPITVIKAIIAHGSQGRSAIFLPVVRVIVEIHPDLADLGI